MNRELAQLRERVRQNRTLASKAPVLVLENSTRAEGRTGGAFVAGDRVFDLVAGELGDVVGGTRENIIVPTAQ